MPLTNMSSGFVEISGSTLILGMLGDPIAQVRTPQTINPIFAALGVDIVCVPLHVSASDLSALWAGLRSVQNFIGFTVTLPHKHDALRLCDSLDAEAVRVNAVNVVRREADGAFRGYQFDSRGFIVGLHRQGHDPRGRDCLIVGSGGAARAIAFGLLDAGAAGVTITDRDKDNARALAEDINRKMKRACAKDGLPDPEGHQILVNATPMGLSVDDPLPLPVERIDATMLVADAIADPPITRFLEEARKRGAAIHSGEHMLINQVGLIAQHFADGMAQYGPA